MNLQIHICKTTNKKNKFRINKCFNILKENLQNFNKGKFLDLKTKCNYLENEIRRFEDIEGNDVVKNLDDVTLSYIEFLENSKIKNNV